MGRRSTACKLHVFFFFFLIYAIEFYYIRSVVGLLHEDFVLLLECHSVCKSVAVSSLPRNSMFIKQSKILIANNAVFLPTGCKYRSHIPFWLGYVLSSILGFA